MFLFIILCFFPVQPEYSLSSYNGLESRSPPITHLNAAISFPNALQLNSEPNITIRNSTNTDMLITMDMSVYNPSGQNSSDDITISLYGLINNNAMNSDIIVITTGVMYNNNTLYASEVLTLNVVEPELDATITMEVSCCILQ